MANKKGMSKTKMAAVGAGVAAIGAGAYYLLGPDGKKHQKKAGAWMTSMKKEVVREAKKAKKMSVPLYNNAVDVVSRTYKAQYKAHEKDIKAFADKLKKEWKQAAEKAAKQVVKKSVKKVKSRVGKMSKKKRA